MKTHYVMQKYVCIWKMEANGFMCRCCVGGVLAVKEHRLAY